MPTRKVAAPRGKKGPCYRYGRTGKVYCGRGAKSKADKQGRAIEISKHKK